jgi:hypothetical protein
MRRVAPLMLMLILTLFVPSRTLWGAAPVSSPDSSGPAGTTSAPSQGPVSQALASTIAAFGLLILCSLLITGTLLVALRQRRELARLGVQMGELRKALDGLKGGLGGVLAKGAPQGQDPRAVNGESPTAVDPKSRSLQERRPGGQTSSSMSTPLSSGERRSSPGTDRGGGSSPVQPHQEIYDLLDRLRREAPRLAAKFADPVLRERFQGELDAPVGARLDRLQALAAGGEEPILQRWLGPDLIATLDSLARFYSEAVEEERRGQANGLALELRNWLYDYFGSACRSEGWFAIDPVEPYRTPFDPKIHHAIAGRDVEGAQGRIVAIQAIGRRDAKTGALLQKAEVTVGR